MITIRISANNITFEGQPAKQFRAEIRRGKKEKTIICSSKVELLKLIKQLAVDNIDV